jgi:glycosyltransferase involved in cell wall biosynthesis
MAEERRKRPRILFLIDSLEGDGAERQFCELVRGVKTRTSYEPHVGVLEAREGHSWMLREAGVPIHQFLRSRRIDISPLFKIRRYLREHSISLVHTYMFLAGEFGLIAAKLQGLPVICASIRNAKDRSWKDSIRVRYQSLLADIAVGNSRAGFTSRFRKMRSHFVVIPNGMDFARFDRGEPERESLRSELRLEREAVVLCMAARFEKNKDHLTLIRAVHQLVGEGREVTLLLPGEGEKRAEMERIASELGLGNRVKFLGHRRDIEGLISLCQVSISLTNTRYHLEGISNSIIESMALRVPVIATRGGGTDELIVDGENCGIKVDCFNIAEVAAAIKHLLDNKPQRDRMVENAYRMVRSRHNLDRYLDDNLKLYARLLGAGAPTLGESPERAGEGGAHP